MSQLDEFSKFLSYVLRHKPEAIGLRLDESGWVEVEHLLERCGAHGKQLTRDLVLEIVATNKKQRFGLREDGRYIRANQGHSIEVDLGYEQQEPPALLYHGTVSVHLDSIRANGLSRMKRHHVHLSTDEETARRVAKRHGNPLILKIAAQNMHADGRFFYRAANGVWLTEAVPPAYIEFPASP